ncbi:hypothetical protein [Sphingomonas sp. NIBR02145]|uniref:hypothetical protein n=2 Tax=unclassified Sphingomonas TaxID=196159 RepID=UPI0022B358B7|nr:hypothetical protein [Sphingomonas sp. NIBR02145]WHU04602.1 hypothetical protein O3305_08450 [Sphingomonas sp. NIBR02145]
MRAMWRFLSFGWIGFVLFGAPVHAQDGPRLQKLSDNYIAYLTGGASTSNGPIEATIRRFSERPAGPKIISAAEWETLVDSRLIPITQLRAMLSNCRGGGTALLWEDKVPEFSRHQFLECVIAGEVRVMYVIVRARQNDGNIVSVKAIEGSPMGWQPPPPSGPAWRQFDEHLFAQYKSTVGRFIDTLSKGTPPSDAHSPKSIELYRDEGDPESISVGALRNITTGCKVAFMAAAKVWIRKEKIQKEGIKTALKCDAASSAPSDIVIYSSFSGVDIDTVAVAAANNYKLPH